MIEYRLTEAPSPGLLRATSQKYGAQLFTSRTARKPTRCEVCRLPIAKGELCWAPLTNGYNRMHRLHGRCFENPPAGKDSA